MTADTETRFQEGRAAVAELLDTMEELELLLAEENHQLRRGLPAGLSEVVERKIELAALYEELCLEIKDFHTALLIAEPDTGRRIASASERLKKLTDENMERLLAAMDASRRRVQAVMSALIAADAQGKPYTQAALAAMPARLTATGTVLCV